MNIQSRAPNSPVIIVATHEDLVEGGAAGPLIGQLQAELFRRFIQVSDHDKCGLPPVFDSLVVSTKTKLNIRALCNRIYDVAFSLRCPGSSERLLEQKIPATYLYLEQIVSSLVHERQLGKREPVLLYQDYRRLVCEQLKLRFNRQFRDLEPANSRQINYNSELQQATRFLHENGVLLHYEDSNLRELYFLDPQWLCDILSHVVTIREINPHVKNGLMRMEDLNHLFKSMEVQVSGGVQSYVVNLLNKFELALTWNSQFLLIPSLLPRTLGGLLESMDQISKQQQQQQQLSSNRGERVKMVAPRMRGRSAVRRHMELAPGGRAASIDPARRRAAAEMGANRWASPSSNWSNFYHFEYEPKRAIRRLILLRYLPAGFLARLQSGLLSEPIFEEICEDLQLDLLNKLLACHGREPTSSLSEQQATSELLEEALAFLGHCPAWLCWSAGIRLQLQHETTINTPPSEPKAAAPTCCLLTIEEFPSFGSPLSSDNLSLQVECLDLQSPTRQQPSGADASTGRPAATACKSDAPNRWQFEPTGVQVLGSSWNQFDQSQCSNVLLVCLPNPKLRITSKADRSVSFALEIGPQITARLLARAVDHIDDLLEDWYPSLGARFAHTLGGSYLVNRIVPCPTCASESALSQTGFNAPATTATAAAAATSGRQSRQARGVQEKRGVAGQEAREPGPRRVYSFYVEHCILNAYNSAPFALPMQTSGGGGGGGGGGASGSRRAHSLGSPARKQARNLLCPEHGPVGLASVAPDIVFADLADAFKMDSEQLERCKLIGRGALGFVFRATLQNGPLALEQPGQANQEVALKLLQPVEPGPEADQADLVGFASARSNWAREPFQCACRAYCSARHELNILQALSHPNIVQLVGLCLRPLALVLELAPLGSLAQLLRNYKAAGRRLEQWCVQRALLQLARALEFLHQRRIIYRDLKSENVLVWAFPEPKQGARARPSGRPPPAELVELKLADYGISRQALSTGIWKGFAGTINFLAPEILRHNGDEEYTEKVDCFSFGMLMYELLTLRPPFKRNPLQPEVGGLCSGARAQLGAVWPALGHRDLVYPNHVWDLMSVCWSQEPHDRPTASQIVSLASAPEFMQVLDAVQLAGGARKLAASECASFACALFRQSSGQLELWHFQHNSAQALDSIQVLRSTNGHWTSSLALDLSSGGGGGDELEQPLELLRSARISAACLVQQSIWLFDSSQSLVHVLPALDEEKEQEEQEDGERAVGRRLVPIQSVALNCARIQVKQMLYVRAHHSLVLLAADGLLWLCNLPNPNPNSNSNSNSTLACSPLDGGFVRFNCIATLSETPSGQPAECFQLFGGQANAVSCLHVSPRDSQVRRQSILPLASKLAAPESADEQQQLQVSCIEASSEHLWTAAGCTVHLWNRRQRLIVRQLDCCKLVPCSESLESINIEQYYLEARDSLVTSLARVQNQLLAATTHGCLVLIEANTLKPIIVFRPFESQANILKPMLAASSAAEAEEQEEADEEQEEQARHLIALGRGYRDLLSRYLSSLARTGGEEEEEEEAEAEVGLADGGRVLAAAIFSAQSQWNI